MIADANGVMPASIRNDADQEFFQAGLDQAAVIVHGRHSHEGGPHAARRKRLVVTRQIAAIAPDPAYPNALLLESDRRDAGRGRRTARRRRRHRRHHRRPRGVQHVPAALRQLSTCRAPRNAKIPGGRPVFNEVGPNATPEDVLMRHGLKARPAARSRRRGGRQRGDVGALTSPHHPGRAAPIISNGAHTRTPVPVPARSGVA